jgi:uncharacterized protein (UPF0333 family)
MDNKAQGAFEYVLLLAGILLIVILVIVILRSSVLNQANAQIRQNTNTIQQLTNCTQINSTTVQCGGTNYTIG